MAEPEAQTAGSPGAAPRPAAKPKTPGQMRAFVRDFFTAFGADVVKDTPTRLCVRLSDDLREHFGVNAMSLVFQAKHADEGMELVTHGSYVMDMIHSVLQDHGWKTFVSLPSRHGLTARDAAKLVSPEACTIGPFRRRKTLQAEVHFHIKVSYQSDEKIEEIVSVRVTEDGGSGPGLSPGQIAKLDAQPTSRGRLSKAKILERFRTAIEYVERQAQQRGAEVHGDMLKRLYRNVTRIKGYYERQIDEAARRSSDPNAADGATALEEEMHMKLREQAENHQLRVVLKLVNLCVLERPVAKLTATLARGRSTADYTLLFDQVDGSLALPQCPECERDMRRPALCDAGHLVCAKCLATCSQCGGTICNRCGVADCRVCEQRLCTSCASRCTSCAQYVCAHHLRACGACGRRVCPECSDACVACGKPTCSDHLRECAACGGRVCHNCQTTCAACGQVFCRTHKEVCGVCGQVVCTGCARRCQTCGKPVCTSHYAECEVCGAAGCRSHFRECAVSETLSCERHGQACCRCGEWTSQACLACALYIYGGKYGRALRRNHERSRAGLRGRSRHGPDQ